MNLFKCCNFLFGWDMNKYMNIKWLIILIILCILGMMLFVFPWVSGMYYMYFKHIF